MTCRNSSLIQPVPYNDRSSYNNILGVSRIKLFVGSKQNSFYTEDSKTISGNTAFMIPGSALESMDISSHNFTSFTA